MTRGTSPDEKLIGSITEGGGTRSRGSALTHDLAFNELSNGTISSNFVSD